MPEAVKVRRTRLCTYYRRRDYCWDLNFNNVQVRCKAKMLCNNAGDGGVRIEQVGGF